MVRQRIVRRCKGRSIEVTNNESISTAEHRSILALTTSPNTDLRPMPPRPYRRKSSGLTGRPAPLTEEGVLLKFVHWKFKASIIIRATRAISWNLKIMHCFMHTIGTLSVPYHFRGLVWCGASWCGGPRIWWCGAVFALWCTICTIGRLVIWTPSDQNNGGGSP